MSKDVERELLAEGVSPATIEEVMKSNRQSPSGIIEFYTLKKVLRTRTDQKEFFERGRWSWSQMPMQSHTFRINGDIEALLKHTKFQKLMELKLPYPSIQIENHSRQFPKIIHISVSEYTGEIREELIKKAYNLSFFYATETGTLTFNAKLNQDFEPILAPEDKAFLMAYYEQLNPALQEALNILKNFINFVNCRECVLIDSKTERIPKHLIYSVTEIPKDPNTSIVAITDKLIRYLNQSQDHGKRDRQDISFWVRGHWRRLQSAHWTHKRGQLTWVRPFIKGEGTLHKHEYKLRKLGGESDGSGA